MNQHVKIHASQVEMLAIDALQGYEKNARTHPDGQIKALVDIIREHGFTTPLLIDDENVIIAGHGRLMAAQKLKMDEVPCVRVSGLSEDQIKALRISDNQTSLMSTWDATLLKVELSDLQGAGFDLSLTGFSSLELNSLFDTREGYTHPDDEPDEEGPAVSQEGDFWHLGDHVLAHGDSTVAATVERVLGGFIPIACISDQPYGTNYVAGRRGTEFLRDGSNRSKGEVRNDHRADWREAWALFPGDVIYVWHNPLEAATVQASLEVNGFELRAQIIWRKVQPVVGPPKGHYRWQHETCIYGVRKGKNANWQGSKKESTVWDADRPKRNDTGHATQKPVELWRKAIENHTVPGDRIYDPFCGSGVCIIAAQMTKRIAHCVEIEGSHVDRALVRFQTFTGVAPILAETGETFEQVKARRAEVV